uniref:Aminotransferase n=1 Tax=Candidatus Kentrum sp. FM TaxID=2126340 RepID=A0A450SID6_9GAMM|nr:MAG: aspartate aminotransferase [Candidatus Kentron sp. FM]VFJ56356.1 MAG: aspartate aminotransferase [Candidatus Kentron sp. FM]VFK11182.1 MAG: aspartate aminotransferase [Candidatus Kentron sp. FM]
MLSDRVQGIKPSPTLALAARAAELKAAGHDIISLSAGEPDFDTPIHIKEAAQKALDDGFTRYTPVDGIPSLKQAIVTKFARDNGFEYSLNQVLVSCGGKQALFNLTQALLNPGDEVIIPSPYWVSYPDIVILAGAKPVVVEAGVEVGFKITPSMIEQAITPKTRLIIINSPSNPSGVAYSRDELVELGEVLRKYPQVFVATDDIYEHILWGEESFSNILMACPDLYDRTVIVHGVSKSYAMTGWRIGYAAGPAKIIQAMKKVQSQSTSNPTSFAQVGAQAALEGDQSFIREMVQIFKGRHNFVVADLNRMKDVTCLPAQGAFYVFPDMRKAIESLDGVEDDIALTEYLIEKAGVVLVPGSAFGAPGFMRISIATGERDLHVAMERLAEVFWSGLRIS